MAAVEAPGVRDPESGLMLPIELSDKGYLQIANTAVSIRIPSTERVYGIGDSLPLIQKNQRYFVGLAQFEDGFKQLIAVRRVLQNGQGTAWVTEQNDLIFGTEMRSEMGLFYLRPSETLPIVGETEETYRILCERKGYTFSLNVLKGTEGLTYLPELPEYMAKRVQQMERMKQRVVMAAPASGSVLDLATTEVGDDPTRLDPLARMLKATKPDAEPEAQSWYAARAAELPPEVEPVVVEAPKTKRLPQPQHMQLHRPTAIPPVVQEVTPEPEATEPAPVDPVPEAVESPSAPVESFPAPSDPPSPPAVVESPPASSPQPLIDASA